MISDFKLNEPYSEWQTIIYPLHHSICSLYSMLNSKTQFAICPAYWAVKYPGLAD